MTTEKRNRNLWEVTDNGKKFYVTKQTGRLVCGCGLFHRGEAATGCKHIQAVLDSEKRQAQPEQPAQVESAPARARSADEILKELGF